MKVSIIETLANFKVRKSCLCFCCNFVVLLFSCNYKVSLTNYQDFYNCPDHF